MQVRAADPAGLDAHFDIPRPQRRDGDFLDAKVFHGMEHGCAHRSFPRVRITLHCLSRLAEGFLMANLFDLTGRIALVTGSSRGIGRAIAEGYVAAGARVLINGRDAAAVDAAVKAIGKNALAAPFDVTNKTVVVSAI